MPGSSDGLMCTSRWGRGDIARPQGVVGILRTAYTEAPTPALTSWVEVVDAKGGDIMDLESNSAEGQGGFDRRSFIRRSALVGAATVWAAPTIQSLVSPA